MKKAHSIAVWVILLIVVVSAAKSNLYPNAFNKEIKSSENIALSSSSKGKEPMFPKMENCPAVNEYYDKLQLAYNELEANGIKNNKESPTDKASSFYEAFSLSIINSPLIMELETQGKINNACGAQSINILDLLFTYVKNKEKADHYRDEYKHLADLGNRDAIIGLCYTHESDVGVKYCEKMINDKKSLYSSHEVEAAKKFTRSFYYLNDDIDSLSSFCATSNANDIECFKKVKNLADDLYKNKQFDVAKKHYQKLVKYYESIQMNNDDQSEEKDIRWRDLVDIYKKLNMTDEMIKVCTTIYDISDSEKSLCIIELGSLGDDAYYKQHDYSKAFKFYTATTQVTGNERNIFKASAEENLGSMYNQGKGVEKNDSEALYWYYKALEQSEYKSVKASIHGEIGYIKYQQKEYVEAFNEFLKSSELGNSWYQANLASMYFHGNGTIQDYEQAYAWSNVALAIGIDNSEHKAFAEAIKIHSRIALLNNYQPGASLSNANALSKKYYRIYTKHQF